MVDMMGVETATTCVATWITIGALPPHKVLPCFEPHLMTTASVDSHTIFSRAVNSNGNH